MPAPAPRPAKHRGALPSAEPSARVAAIVADGAATSPPKLPAALASSTWGWRDFPRSPTTAT